MNKSKYLILGVLSIFFQSISGVAYSQVNFDSLVEKNRVFDCEDVASMSAAMFQNYYEEGRADSAQYLLEYWRGKCGYTEPIVRAETLLKLKNGSSIEDSSTEELLSSIYTYRSKLSLERSSNYNNYYSDSPYFGFIPVGSEFDKFTKRSAERLKERYDSNSLEYAICEFYEGSTDTLLTKLQGEELSGSPLGVELNREINSLLDQSDMHFAFITGLWVPTGDLSLLGVHPEIGFMLGAKCKKMSYDITMAFKFLDAKESYIASYDGGEHVTDHFFGGYIGADIGRDIYSYKRGELRLLAGIAFDGFDVVQSDEESDIEGVSSSTYNINMGLGYRYYLSNRFYLGLRTKYNIVDYSRGGVVDMSGNTISIQLTVGWLGNFSKYENLSYLGYRNSRTKR